MFDLLSRLFSTNGFMPHGHCYLWNPGLVWLNVISDGLTAAAYTTIPFTLLYYVRKRGESPLNWIYVCFGVFIIACGATHLLDIYTLWTPSYWLLGIAKAVTALASVPTAALLVHLVPKALNMPTTDKMAAVMAELRETQAVLETKVRERTEELTKKNEQLAAEIAQRTLAEAALRSNEAQRVIDAKFKALLESAPDAMVIVDSTGRIALINGQTENLFGYRRDELVGQNVDLLVPNRFQAGHAGNRKNYFANPKIRQMGSGVELHGRRKDGTEFPVEISLSPLATDEGLLVSSAIRDVTVRRFTEAALRTSNRELESFSYSVAHDLRTPLRGINGFAHVLADDHRDRLNEEGLQCLRKIQESTLQMAELIDALLSLARVSRSELHLERVDLSAVVRAVAEQLKAADPNHDVEVVIAEGLSANGDAALIEALLENLIGNAWKFTRKRERARIEFGVTSSEGRPAFFVRDNGAGFDMQHAGKLFTAFQRLHSPREFSGTGIGLATCHRIVGRHGGQIWAEGNVSLGATFFFWLPENAV